MLISGTPRAGLSFFVAGFLLFNACADLPSSALPDADDNDVRSAVQWAGNPELAKVLSQARAGTAAFHDPAVALAAGYRATPICVASGTGAMGRHYSNGALLGVIPGSDPLNGTDAVIDPARPEVLLYEPQADGSVRLVGIEYVVFRSAWDAVHSEPPTLAGIPFDQKFGPDSHGISDHYELHVWLWRSNPLGMFSPYNPKVSCQP